MNRFLLLTFLSISTFAMPLVPDTSIPSPSEAVKILGDAEYKSLSPKSIKILNWNIYKGSKKNWIRDYNRINDKYDIITLQEIVSKAPVENILSQDIQRQRVYAYSFKYEETNIYTGLVTLSKAKATTYEYRVTDDFEPIIATPKVSLYTTYPIHGENEELLVANIHSINFVGQQAFENQLQQAKEEISKHDGPVVFAGDFNTWSVKRLLFLRKTMKSLGLNSVRFTPDTRKKVIGLALDHIFVRGLEVINSKSLDHIRSSDHVAMEVELKIIKE